MSFVKTLLYICIGMSLVMSQSFASPSKGQKIIIKKLKKPCGFNGAVLAKKHTQDEWKKIYYEGKLNEEIKRFCPKVKDDLSKKYSRHVYDFLYNYASDSGNVPS